MFYTKYEGQLFNFKSMHTCVHIHMYVMYVMYFFRMHYYSVVILHFTLYTL